MPFSTQTRKKSISKECGLVDNCLEKPLILYDICIEDNVNKGERIKEKRYLRRKRRKRVYRKSVVSLIIVSKPLIPASYPL